MDNNKLLQEIFKDDEKFEIYLNELFLNPPRPKDVFLDSASVDFLTKYRKDGRTDVTEKAIELLYHNLQSRFGYDVRIVPKLSIEGDRTKMTLYVCKDINSVNQSEISGEKTHALVLKDNLKKLAEDHAGEGWVELYRIKEAADRLDELDADLFTQKKLATKYYLELKKVLALQKMERNNE